MTILHSGSSRKFADNWLKIFAGRRKPATSATTKRSTAKASTSTKSSSRSVSRKKKAAVKKSVSRRGKR